MKIIHTADWHIGKKLHKYDLHTDFELFINWLYDFIVQENVAVLLVSGDIFDMANPSAQARQQYYRTLNKLRATGCKIILTGGNHDSPSMLDAPKEILNALNVSIIGGMPSKIEDCLLPLEDETGQTELLVAAVPFLRDSDLRSAESDTVHENRIEAVKSGIETVFSEVISHCKSRFPNVPALMMGHLYTAGIEASDSERDIQIGNQAAFQAARFGDYFKYAALGHIHKPQQVSAPIPTFYSGSPLPLSFSERRDEKRLLLLDTAEGFEPKSIPIPHFRKLLRITGNLPEIKEKLAALKPVGSLTNLIEVELKEDDYDANHIAQLDRLVTNFKNPKLEIVKHRIHFKNQLRESGTLFENHQHLEDLKPQEVFHKLLEQHSYKPEMKEKVSNAFQELLEKVDY